MSQMVGVPTSWKGTRSAEAAAQLIDYGVMLRWRDMRTIKRTLTDEEQKQIRRDQAEVTIETHCD